MSQSQITIQKGSILIYRVFDVAEEVNLEQVEQILSKQQGESRLRLGRGGRKSAVIIRNAPIRLHLGEIELILGKDTYRAEVLSKVWDYGALSICFQVPIPKGMPWDRLISLASLLSGEASDIEIDPIARRKASELCELIKSALKTPSHWEVFEDYIIYFLEEVAGATTGTELSARANIPALLLGETQETLATISRNSILEHTYQYAMNDLVVIDWNSAAILEPSGSRDIPDVLEFALSHLLEVRYFDDLIDRRLGELYDSIEAKRSRIFRKDFASASHEASTRFIEFSEFMERVDNSLKVVGDFYLAVIFRAAARRFRIEDWQANITRKMNMFARVSELLQGEINAYRSHALEVIIILLIAFEIVSAILKGAH